VSFAELTVAEWASRTGESATRIAREIANRHDLRVVQVRVHEFAARDHRLALFERAGLTFALVPGGTVTLGYDGAGFVPSPEQVASYDGSAEAYGLPAMGEYVDQMTSPVRVVTLPAMLVAVEAFGATLDEVDSGDRGQPEGHFQMAMRYVSSLGLRAASPDEWEYACGAGSRTLFRWGDATPEDDPYDNRIGPHRHPNLWGLRIGQDPYRHEWTSQRAVVCGGDGGESLCGGYGVFVSWLTLATAYRNAYFGQWLDSEDGFEDQFLTRPVVDLT
jgi:hypothetical protein